MDQPFYKTLWTLFRIMQKGENHALSASTRAKATKRSSLFGKKRPLAMAPNGLSQKMGKAGKILLTLLSSAFIFLIFASMGMSLGMLKNFPETLFYVGFVTAFFTLFFYSFYAISQLYFSSDISFYLGLPLSKRVILGAKVCQSLYAQLSTLLASLGLILGAASAQHPTLRGLLRLHVSPFALNTKLSWGDLVLGLLAGFASTLYSAMFIILLIGFLMHTLRLFKSKDQFSMWSGIILICFALFLGVGSSYISSQSHEQSNAWAKALDTVGVHPVVQVLVWIFAMPLALMQKALTSQGLLKLLCIVLVVAVPLIITYITLLITGKNYFKTILRLNSLGGMKKKDIKAEDIVKSSRRRSAVRSLFAQDMKRIRRSPALFQQLMLSAFLMPVYFLAVIGIAVYGAAKSEGSNLLLGLRLFLPTIHIGSFEYNFFVLGMILYATLGGGAGMTAMSSFSRDGEDLFHFKAMPISPSQYFHSKVLSIFVLGVGPNFVLFILFMIGLLALGVPTLSVLLLALIGICLMLAMPMVSMLLDFWPNLHWTDELRMMKGGRMALRAYIQILINLFLVVLPGGWLVLVYLYRWVTPLTALLPAAIYCILSPIVVYLLIRSFFHRRYIQMS